MIKMFELKYKNKNNNKIMIEQIVAKKEKTAKEYAKQFLLHHNEFELLAIRPC